MALDHPEAALTLAVMDIVPTHAMFMDTNWKVAGAYWYWYFLAPPEPFPSKTTVIPLRFERSRNLASTPYCLVNY